MSQGVKANRHGLQSSGVRALRVGFSPYLNVLPLTWGLGRAAAARGMVLEYVNAVPSRMALDLQAGACDVALTPVFEYIRRPCYTVIPNMCVSTLRTVLSVALYSSVPLEKMSRVYMDEASLTSVNLLRVLLDERGLAPQVAHHAADAPLPQLANGEGALLIGDRALTAIGRYPHCYDMGELWNDLTGLPFVFAAWLVRPGLACAAVNELFLEAKAEGLANLPRIAQECAPECGFTPEFVLDYFRNNISYDLGPGHLRGWEEYARMCAGHGLVDMAPPVRLHDSSGNRATPAPT